jgi:hypothetical protein
VFTLRVDHSGGSEPLTCLSFCDKMGLSATLMCVVSLRTGD